MISINKRIICSIGLLQEGSTQKGKHYHFIIVARAIAVDFFSKSQQEDKAGDPEPIHFDDRATKTGLQAE